MPDGLSFFVVVVLTMMPTAALSVVFVLSPLSYLSLLPLPEQLGYFHICFSYCWFFVYVLLLFVWGDLDADSRLSVLREELSRLFQSGL